MRRHTSMHTATIDPVVQMGIRLGGEGTGGVKTISGDWRSVGHVRERDILVGRCVE